MINASFIPWETPRYLIFPCLCRVQYGTAQSSSTCILLVKTLEEEGPNSATCFKSRAVTAALPPSWPPADAGVTGHLRVLLAGGFARWAGQLQLALLSSLAQVKHSLCCAIPCLP